MLSEILKPSEYIVMIFKLLSDAKERKTNALFDDDTDSKGITLPINMCKYKYRSLRSTELIDPVYEKKRFVIVKDVYSHFGTNRMFIVDDEGVVIDIYDERYDRKYDKYSDEYINKLKESLLLLLKIKSNSVRAYVRSNVINHIQSIEIASQDVSDFEIMQHSYQETLNKTENIQKDKIINKNNKNINKK